MKKIKNSILLTSSIREAVKKIDVENINSLIIVDKNNKVHGIFTLGDFRRVALRGIDMNEKISSVSNKDFSFLFKGYSKNQAKKIFLSNNYIRDIPVLNKKYQLINSISRNEIINNNEFKKEKFNLRNIPVVIMAGGQGVRMDPFTRILPKPLIPIGNEPIIKIIMDEFHKFGLNKFHISINYKGQMIKGYFHDNDLPYKIKFTEETKKLGTVGALSKIKIKSGNNIFLSNCDIIIHSDYRDIYNFHVNGGFDLTLVASIRNYNIPYGVCETNELGELKSIKEKPKFNFLVNTGLYVLKSSIIKLIPSNKLFNMTDLIKLLQSRNNKIGVYPVSEKSWIDVGQWDEYSKVSKKLT